jgi:hypothetical protein
MVKSEHGPMIISNTRKRQDYLSDKYLRICPRPSPGFSPPIRWLVALFLFLAQVAILAQTTSDKSAIDQLIPWLLDEQAISAALDQTVNRLNSPGSRVQDADRINEVSSHVEDTLRELLNATAGLTCDFPHTANDKVQRSGYPDLRIVDVASKRVFYLDPKLYAVGAGTAASARSILSRRLRPTKCTMTRCI